MGAKPGDAVLYHDGTGTTHLGRVVRVADHDGDADIHYVDRDDLNALDVKEGDGPHTYERLDRPQRYRTWSDR